MDRVVKYIEVVQTQHFIQEISIGKNKALSVK